MHIVSTGNGADDAFAALYENAAAGRGAHRTLFIGSDADPRRDANWYRLNVSEAADPESARREHARCVADAFRSPEGAYFKRFRSERHVTAVAIVRHWPTWRAIDFGYRHPACLWAQRSAAGQLFVVDELLPREHNDTGVRRERSRHARRSFGLAAPVILKLLRPGRQGGQRADRRV